MDVYLIRHTRVACAGHCYGWLDVPLAETFEEEAAAVAARLPRGKPDLVVSSPLTRCRRLAATLAPDHAIDADLRELSFGAWEGIPWDSIPRSELDRWALDVGGYTVPGGGESFLDLQRRSLAALGRLPRVERVFCVTHAGVIRAVLGHLRGLDARAAIELPVDYGSVTPVRL